MPPRQHADRDEERPLLQSDGDTDIASQYSVENVQVRFSPDDPENPRAWEQRKKITNVAIIALMAVLTPLASSMFTPGITQIAEDLHTSEQKVIATTTGFVIMMGLGPLLWAPLSEDFGRRTLYIFCFAVFTVLQVASAISPNIETLIAMRTISGFFGSVGLANGGGTINDMYEPSQRAGVFGWYLLGPLLGPTLGPLFGGVIVTRLGWRWIYWVMTIVCAVNTGIGYLFLKESYAPVLLARRKADIETHQDGEGLASNTKTRYYFEGEDNRPLLQKLLSSVQRPFVIFVQPIVLVMSLYQALIFGTTYSIYTNMQNIYAADPYNFSSEQIGLLYLGPGLGFLTSVRFLVPRIDTVFNTLTQRNNGHALPEYRLPLANIGSVLIPTSLFWFAWTVQTKQHWMASISATYFYGIGQVVVFNAVQNYYIDSFATYAASAIAGGSVFRSLVGGIVPLFAPMLFDKLGYGWGVSCFGFVAVLVAPSPLLFYYYGERIRERFRIKL